MMVVFSHQYFRESTIERGPILFEGHRLRLVRHEEADFRVVYHYDHLVEFAATNFPPEHWNKAGITRAFQALGDVCCVAASSLRQVDDRRDAGIEDYSVVRVLVLVNISKVKGKLLVRNPSGEVAGIADVRIVGQWPHAPGAPAPSGHVFSDGSSGDSSGGDDGAGDQDSPDINLPRAPMGSTPAPRPVENAGSGGGTSNGCRALGGLLYPSVPLWTFVAGAVAALSHALSLGGVPTMVIRDLPAPVHAPSPLPRAAPPLLPSDDDSDSITEPRVLPGHAIPAPSDLLVEEDHELSIRRHRARRRRAVASVIKERRSSRLAEKEEPYYVNATTKSARLKAGKLDITKASARMKDALRGSNVLERPAPKKISTTKLWMLGRACGLAKLSEVEDGEGDEP